MAKKGVLLVNLGTPDSPSVKDVRKYLREFLLDKRVLDIARWQRAILVNAIIAPFRAPKSAKVYQKLWTEKGSPLLFYGRSVEQLLQEQLGNDYKVVLAMRYQSPSIDQGLQQLQALNVEEIIVLPLFPQYASASTGSVHDKVMEIVQTWGFIPNLRFISEYCNDPHFIAAFAARGNEYLQKHTYDHIVFSYHGIPERQLTKHDLSNTCLSTQNCCATYHEKNRLCYRAQCFETTRHLAKSLNLSESQYTISFQSRLGKTPWIKPYTDELIPELVKSGKKNVLVFSPSFVADCLETTIEIGEEYKELFESLGGSHWQLVESLNDSPLWIDALTKMVKEG